MGIRYYAYAFDADMTELALADPMRVIGDDPLADAWGLRRGEEGLIATFAQDSPRTELLYLDKAWSYLQALSAPSTSHEVPRPAYRMFEGRVTFTDQGWDAWVRALAPGDVAEIAGDLVDLQRSVADLAELGRDAEYVHHFLQRAVEFVTHTASSGRGFAYTIG